MWCYLTDQLGRTKQMYAAIPRGPSRACVGLREYTLRIRP